MKLKCYIALPTKSLKLIVINEINDTPQLEQQKNEMKMKIKQKTKGIIIIITICKLVYISYHQRSP